MFTHNIFIKGEIKIERGKTERSIIGSAISKGSIFPFSSF